MGTDESQGVCNSETGQCPCLKNVDGLECDRCAPGYYNLASGEGCQECNCDKDGSLEGSCNQVLFKSGFYISNKFRMEVNLTRKIRNLECAHDRLSRYLFNK